MVASRYAWVVTPIGHPPHAEDVAAPQDPELARRVVIAGFATMALAGCGSGEGGTGAERSTTSATSVPSAGIDLPPPAESSFPLDRALRLRRSVREFGGGALTTAQVGQLLWAAQGVTADWGGRTAPSAGALYPLELYAATTDRLLRYVSDGHRAEITANADVRPDLEAATGGQAPITEAPLVVAVVGVPSRSAETYGDRAPRYVDLEAGHAAQNLLLQAVAIELAAVPIGAFDDRAVATALRLPQGQEPRYLIPVGPPRRAGGSSPQD